MVTNIPSLNSLAAHEPERSGTQGKERWIWFGNCGAELDVRPLWHRRM